MGNHKIFAGGWNIKQDAACQAPSLFEGDSKMPLLLSWRKEKSETSVGVSTTSNSGNGSSSRSSARSSRGGESRQSKKKIPQSTDARLSQLRLEKRELQRRLDQQKTSLEHLTTIIKACHDPLASLPLQPDDTNNMTTLQATMLTITNLRDQVEAMEDERDDFILSLHQVRSRNAQLQMENEAQSLKIQTLERVLLQLQDDESKTSGKNSGGSHGRSLTDVSDTSNTGSSGSRENKIPPMVVLTQFENSGFFQRDTYQGANAITADEEEDDDDDEVYQSEFRRAI